MGKHLMIYHPKASSSKHTTSPKLASSPFDGQTTTKCVAEHPRECPPAVNQLFRVTYNLCLVEIRSVFQSMSQNKLPVVEINQITITHSNCQENKVNQNYKRYWVTRERGKKMPRLPFSRTDICLSNGTNDHQFLLQSKGFHNAPLST